MCFMPQQRALLRHLNFQTWSECEMLLFFISKCVSRNTGVVQFFMSHLTTWLRTGRFSEPTFPSGATNH